MASVTVTRHSQVTIPKKIREAARNSGRRQGEDESGGRQQNND